MEQCETCSGTGWIYFGKDGDYGKDGCPDCAAEPIKRLFQFADDEDYLDPFADADDCRAEALTIAERN